MDKQRMRARDDAAEGPLAVPIAGLVAGMFSTQWGASLAKGLFPVVGVMGTAALRISFAALLLTLVMAPWRARLTLRNIRSVLFYGVTLGAMNLLFYKSISLIPLGVAVTIEFIGPLAVAMAVSRRPIDYFWALVAMLGLMLLAPWNPEANHALDPVGIGFALCAAAAWGSYIVAGRAVSHEHGPRATALGMIVAAVIALPVGLAEQGSKLFDPALIPLALVVALFSSALPYTLEMYGLRRIPAKTFSTLMSLEPAVAALIGYIWLDEKLAPRHWAALLAIMLASAGATWTAARSRRAD